MSTALPAGPTPAAELPIEQFPGDRERNGFLAPIANVDGVEHIGWYGHNAIYGLTPDATATGVANQLQERMADGKFKSSGMTIAILPASDSLTDDPHPLNRARIRLQVEDWFPARIPNNPLSNSEKQEHIDEQETRMRNRIIYRYDPNRLTILRDTHTDHGALHGQYQFLALID